MTVAVHDYVARKDYVHAGTKRYALVVFDEHNTSEGCAIDTVEHVAAIVVSYMQRYPDS